MLIEKGYKRNNLGIISKNEIVEMQCDKCGRHWNCLFSARKNKILQDDLCRSCRGKLGMAKQIKKPWECAKPPRKSSKIEIICLNCGIKKLKIPCLVNEVNNFCSVLCRDEYWLKIKYGNLEPVFEKNINEVAYLMGLILGDGSIRKSGKKTIRVGIAFDFSGKWTEIMDATKEILNTLQINWFEEEKSHNHCKMVGFVLPNSLMEKYRMFYWGDKFKNQPCPSDSICNNINYAVGLLNSDGHARKGSYVFVNTVKSIVDSFSKCLSFNGIKHTVTEQHGCFDKRTNRINKKTYNVYIGSKPVIEKLKSVCGFKLKQIKETKGEVCHSL